MKEKYLLETLPHITYEVIVKKWLNGDSPHLQSVYNLEN